MFSKSTQLFSSMSLIALSMMILLQVIHLPASLPRYVKGTLPSFQSLHRDSYSQRDIWKRIIWRELKTFQLEGDLSSTFGQLFHI